MEIKDTTYSHQQRCVVCLGEFSSIDNLCSKGYEFGGIWKTFLHMFQFEALKYADIEHYFLRNNSTPFCDSCVNLLTTLLVLNDQLIMGSITPQTEVKRNIVTTRIIQSIIESNIDHQQTNISYFPDDNSSLGETIHMRISTLRKNILLGFMPIVFLRDCRALYPNLNLISPPIVPVALRIVDPNFKIKTEPANTDHIHPYVDYNEAFPIISEQIAQACVRQQFATINEAEELNSELLEPMDEIDDSEDFIPKKSNPKRTKAKTRKEEAFLKNLSKTEPVFIKMGNGNNCELCDIKTFKSTFNLMRHIQKVHKRRVVKVARDNSRKVYPTLSRPPKSDLEVGGWTITKTDAGFVCICGVQDADQNVIKNHIQIEHLALRDPDQFPVRGAGDKARHLGNGKYSYKDIWIFEFKEHGKYVCSACSIEKNRKKSMVEHMKTKHTPETCRFYCKNCNVGFTSRSYFLRHEKRHKKQRWWKIDKTSYIYDNKFTFKRVEDKFQCDTCALVVDKFFFMTQHVRDVHSVPEESTCKRCGRSFGHRRFYWKHMKTCAQRDFRMLENGILLYREKFEVEIFQTTHPNGMICDRYKCLTCRQERGSRAALFRHIRMKHIDIVTGDDATK